MPAPPTSGPGRLGCQEAVNPVWHPSGSPGGTLRFSPPQEKILREWALQAGGDPVPRRSDAPSVRPPQSRIGIPIRRYRCSEAGG